MDPERSCRTINNERGYIEDRQCSTWSSEVLQEQMNDNQSYCKYSNTEYDEPYEVNKLEKQVEHEDCVSSIEKEELLKNELKRLNKTVQDLSQHNEDLQITVQSKETQIAKLKSSLSSCQEVQSSTLQSINNIGVKLNQFLTGILEDSSEENPSSLSLLTNNPDDRGSDMGHQRNSSNDYSVEDILKLIDIFLKYCNETSEQKFKKCPMNFKSSSAEMLSLKSELLESDIDNSNLIQNQEKLPHLSKCERNSVLHLQNSLMIPKEIAKTEKDLLEDLNPCMNFIQHISFMDTELSDLTELCRDIKSGVSKIYNDVSSNSNQETKIFCSEFPQKISDYEYVMYLKQELEQVKKECSQVSSHSQRVSKSVEEGKFVIKTLERDINQIKKECMVNKYVISSLKKTVNDGQSKIKEQEKEINNYLLKINTMERGKAYLENEVKTFSDKIYLLGNILSKFNIDVPFDTSNLNNFIAQVSEVFKQSVKQYSLLTSYVKDLENKYLFTQKKSASLAKEVDELKRHLIRTKNQIEEADIFLNRIISNIPYKVFSIYHAMEAADHIFAEFKILKEKEVVIFDEQKASREKLADQNKDISSLEKYNSDLKVQLGSYENEIRNLRTELRNLNRKERLRVINNEQDHRQAGFVDGLFNLTSAF